MGEKINWKYGIIEAALVFIMAIFLGLFLYHVVYPQNHHWMFQHRANNVQPYAFYEQIIRVSQYDPDEGRSFAGFINGRGEVVYDFVFTSASDFIAGKGIAVVTKEDGSFALIPIENERGLAVATKRNGTQAFITPDFESIYEISGNSIEMFVLFWMGDIAMITLEGVTSILNSQLEFIYSVPSDYYIRIIDNNNGFIFIRTDYNLEPDTRSRTAIINNSGEYVLKDIFGDEDINIGRWYWSGNHLLSGYGFRENDKRDFRKFDGTMVIEPRYDYVRPISENIIVVATGDNAGFIDIDTGFESGLLYMRSATLPLNSIGGRTFETCLLLFIAYGSIICTNFALL